MSSGTTAAGTLRDEILDAVPALRRRPREVVELTGGLTNRNFKVTTPDGCYVARRWSDDTGALAINRDHEHRNSVLAAQAGVGAPVIDYRPDLRVLVVGFLDGTTLTNDSFAVGDTVERVAAAVRTLHEGPRFGNDFDMFAIQRRYLRIVRDNGYRLPAGYDEFAPHVERIKAALAVRDAGTVPCNNDLLAANFIDDGAKIWLIDYEYSGNNDACFELGNIWSECHLDADQLDTLVSTYYARRLRHKIARAQLQGLLAKYGWTLWASIQQASSPIDFDFWEWGMEKYDGAVAVFRSPRFEALLAEAERAD